MRPRLVQSIFVLMGLAILILSLSPNVNAGHVDKLLHYSVYGCWAFAVLLGVHTNAVRIVVVVAMLLVGLAMEIVQPLFGRTFSFDDMAANAIGVFTGLGAVFYLRYSDWRSPEIRVTALIVGVVAVTLSLYVWPRLLYYASMMNWNCDYPLAVGGHPEGDTAWQGDLICARLIVGGRRLAPSGAEKPVCGNGAGLPPGGAAMLELGSLTPRGTPGPDAPLGDPETRAFCEAAKINRHLVLEAWLHNGGQDRTAPAPILALAQSERKNNLTLAQIGQSFDFHVRTRNTWQKRPKPAVATLSGTAPAGPIKVTAQFHNGAASVDTSLGASTGTIWTLPLFPDRIFRALGTLALVTGFMLGVFALLYLIRWLAQGIRERCPDLIRPGARRVK